MMGFDFSNIRTVRWVVLADLVIVFLVWLWSPGIAIGIAAGVMVQTGHALGKFDGLTGRSPLFVFLPWLEKYDDQRSATPPRS